MQKMEIDILNRNSGKRCVPTQRTADSRLSVLRTIIEYFDNALVISMSVYLTNRQINDSSIQLVTCNPVGS